MYLIHQKKTLKAKKTTQY